MANEQEQVINSIRESLGFLRDEGRVSRNNENIERDIRALSEKLTEIKHSVERSENNRIDLSPIITAQAELSRKITDLERKTAPMTVVIGTLMAIVAATGGAFLQVFSLKDPVNKAVESINDTGKKITSAREDLDKAKSEVRDSVFELKGTANTLTQRNNEVLKASAEFEEYLKEFRGKLESELEKITSFDKMVSRIIGNLNKVSRSTKALSVEPVGHPSTEDPGADVIEALVGQLGNRMPRYMRLRLKADKELDKDNFAAARTMFAEAKRMDPDKKDSSYDFRIAQSYFRENNYDKAIDSFQDALDIEPTSSSTLNNMGSAYFSKSKLESNKSKKEALLRKSLDYHQQAIKIPTDNPSPVQYANTAVVLNALGRYEEALGILKSYGGEKSAAVFLVLSNTYAALGQQANAIDSISKGLAADKSYALIAALDDDLAPLRQNPAFRDLLREFLGSELFSRVSEDW